MDGIIPFALLKKLPGIGLGVTDAVSGQMIRASGVDADGKPTGWEAIDGVHIVTLRDGTMTLADLAALLSAINAAGEHVFFDTAALAYPLYLCTIAINYDDQGQLASYRLNDLVTGRVAASVWSDSKTLAEVLAEAHLPAAYPTHIAVTTPPTNTQYYNGQSFDPTGMVVTLYWSNGFTEVLDNADLAFSPSVFAAGDTYVTITANPAPYTLTTTTPVQITDIDAVYRARVQRAADKAAVDGYFAEWWALVYEDGADKTALLDRWFGNVMVDDLVLGVKLPLFATSTATAGELIEDSAGLVCVPSTATVAGRDDFARLPQMWVLEVSAERNADGTVSIYAIQHIDDLADVRSGAQHLCMVLTKNAYWREYTENGYTYIKQSCTPFPGAALWQGANAQGVSYRFAAWPKYMAGWTDAARTTVGCGTGLAPCCNVSHDAGLTKWRARASHYSGGSYKTQKWQQVMVALKYAVKGNSGTIEGCSSYNFEYAAAVSETGVERVLVTTAQAANLLVGSSVCIGARGAVAIRITSIETVEIDGTTYGAVYVDNGGVTFDTTAGTTYIRTMPYYSGYNDTVLGVDGSRTNYTNGKEPGLIQGTEFMTGAWHIQSDALLLWTQTGNDYTLDMYLCPDPSKAASSVTEDYVKLEGGTLTNPTNGWQSIRDMLPAPACWPAGLGGGASTSNGCRASLYVFRGSGVRAAWAGGSLFYPGIAGLAAAISDSAPGIASWSGALGSPSVTG